MGRFGRRRHETRNLWCRYFISQEREWNWRLITLLFLKDFPIDCLSDFLNFLRLYCLPFIFSYFIIRLHVSRPALLATIPLLQFRTSLSYLFDTFLNF